MRRLTRGMTAAALAAGVHVLTAPAAGLALTPALPPATPLGAGTVSSEWRGPMTAEGRRPEVLQAVRITVGENSRPGLVRLRVSDPQIDPGRGVRLGDWFPLPVEPGVYTFPVPRVVFDYRSLVLALDQQSGGHAIVEQTSCRPEYGDSGDPCQLASLDSWSPILPDALAGLPPESSGGEPAPTSRQPGWTLRIATVSEPDVDKDLAGDTTEDRTDLSVRADAVRGSGGRTTITVTNNGPRAADIPWVMLDRMQTSWTPACARPDDAAWPPLTLDTASACRLPALPPGGSHTLSVPTGGDGRLGVSVASEGPDLQPADNAIAVLPGDPPTRARNVATPRTTLSVPARARASKGATIRLRTAQAATARMTLTTRWRGKPRRTSRTIALRAGVARTVTLRPPRVGGLHPTGRARLTVTITSPGARPRTLTRSVRLVR